MKFLLYIKLINCKKLCHLPSTIIKLVHLRSLNIDGSNVSVITKGFGELTNLSLSGFPVHMDMDPSSSWCSLQELAPLSQLRELTLYGLEKVQDIQMAEKAMISSKRHLEYLELNYSASGHTIGIGRSSEAEQQQQQTITMEVLENLCPPTGIENLRVIGGYIGRQLPNWMHAPAMAHIKSLRYLTLENMPSCTQLPDGLCCLQSLESLHIRDAPAIKHIGPQFQASSPLAAGSSTVISAPFPKLKELYLDGLLEWEEWEWNDREEHMDVETAIAMPCLETLKIKNCKLSCLPPGLASSKRHALRELWLYELTNLTYVENFPSVVELDVFDCPELKRISGLPRMLKIRILRCTKLEAMEGVPALDSLVLADTTMETLPEYLRAVNPRYFELHCNKKLHESSLSPGSSEWNKISHIRKHNIVCIRG
jgi:hypothetical protein